MGSFIAKSEKRWVLIRGFRQWWSSQSISLSDSQDGWKRKQYARKFIFFFLTSQHVFCWLNLYDFAVSSFAAVVKFSWQNRQLYFLDIVGLKVRSSSISLTQIDIFCTPCPVVRNIGLLKVTRSARTRVPEPNAQHQNGWSITSTYIEMALGSMSFIRLLMLLAPYCFHFYVEWMTFNPKGALLIGS